MAAPAQTPPEDLGTVPGSSGPAPGAPEDADRTRERLAHMRTIVPVFAHELTSARRQAAALRRQNRRLLERIRELQRERR